MSAHHASLLISNALVLIVSARLLSTAAYGRFMIAMLLLSWMTSVISSVVLPGLRKIVSEDAGRFPAALGCAARWYLPVVGLLTVAFCALSPVLSSAFRDPALAGLFLLAGLQIPFVSAICLGKQLLGGVRQFARASLTGTSRALLGAIAACALLLLGRGPTGAMLGLWVGAAGGAAVSVWLLLRQRRRAPHTPYPPMSKRVRHWTAVSLPRTVGMRTVESLDIWLVKALLPASGAAGLYAAAYALARLPLFLVHGLGDAVFPRVSGALEQGDRRLARSIAVEAMRFVMVLFIPISFITAGAAGEIVTLLFSGRYAEAAPSLIVLTPAIFLAGLTHCSLRLVAAAGRPGLAMLVTLALLAIAATGNVLLILHVGMLGAAVASLVTFAGGAAAGTALAYRLLGVLPPARTILRCVVAGAAAGLLAWLWPASGWLVVAKLIAAGLLYLAILLALRELKTEDLGTIKRSIRS